MTMEYTKLKKKYSTHLHKSWSKCMTSLSIGSGFWLSNMTWCKYATFIPTQAPHKP
jgi:hypothetical protein